MRKKIHYTKNYARERLVSPKKFKKNSFRTKSVSKNTKIILGRLKSGNKWHIQAILNKRKGRRK